MRFSSLLFVFCSAAIAACGGSTASDPVEGDAPELSTKTLLDCNLASGPDQQVTVVQRKGALVLRELTDHGSMEERPLGASEWSDKSIKLRHDRFDGPDVENRLWKDKGDWIYKSSGGGFSDTGFADCWVDKSK